MFITSDHGRSARVKRANLQLAAQLLVIALTAYFVPLIAPLILFGDAARHVASTTNTQATSAVAAIAALVIFSRITAFPGTRAFGFIVPAFSTTFGLSAVMLLLLRVPYSGPMLITGYLASIAASFVAGFFVQRTAPLRFYYVPTGNMSLIKESAGVEWVKLAEPTIPLDPTASIVADLRSAHAHDWERMLAEAAISGIPVYHSKQLHETLTGRVRIEHLSENSFGSLLPAMSYRGVKRAIDLIASFVVLPILVLPMLIIALLVRASSPGPVFFRQERMGYRGKPFLMLKFRTMRVRETKDHGEACERRAAITQVGDDRVTGIGRFLRKSRVDELPQIVNILRGEMSWIGPRPEAVPLSKWYEQEIPFYRYRHIVRPGITGWAQVNQGHVAELDDVNVKLHYDFYYIKFFSFWLDFLIALRTAGIMLTGFGAK